MNYLRQYIVLILIVFFYSCNERSEKNRKISSDKLHENIDSLGIYVDKSLEDSLGFNINELSFYPKHKNNRKAIKINNKALGSMQYFLPPSNSDDTIKLLKAIEKFDQAIQVDSLYNLAYSNKAMVLRNLGREREAIGVLRKIALLRPDDAEGITVLGISYEKLGVMDSANIYYKQAIESYSVRILQSNTIGDLVNRAYLIFLFDEELGQKEMNRIIEEYKDDETLLLLMPQLMQPFDRKAFINLI